MADRTRPSLRRAVAVAAPQSGTAALQCDARRSDGRVRPHSEGAHGSAPADLGSQPTTEVLPALGLLMHRVTVLPLDAGALVDRPLGDLVLLDARRELAGAKTFSRVLS